MSILKQALGLVSAKSGKGQLSKQRPPVDSNIETLRKFTSVHLLSTTQGVRT